jgi:hypothetical protein
MPPRRWDAHARVRRPDPLDFEQRGQAGGRAQGVGLHPSYWSKEPWFPDPCAKGNVMYTGHLMMLMALEQALTGDPSSAARGDAGLGRCAPFHLHLETAADVTAAQIRAGDAVCRARPGAGVFSPATTIPHDTFRLLEGMGYGTGGRKATSGRNGPCAGFRRRRRWRARVFHHVREPLHAGRHAGVRRLVSDVVFALDVRSRDVSKLWRLAKKKLDWTLFGDDPPTCCRLRKGCCCGGGGACPLAVPLATTASFLATAARACGDSETAGRLETWLDGHFLKKGKRAVVAQRQSRMAYRGDGERFLRWRRRTVRIWGHDPTAPAAQTISTVCCWSG